MLQEELRTACRLAREAGAAIEHVRRTGFEAMTKADESPVTRADLAADAILSRGLTDAFPMDGYLSEESARLEGRSGRTWIIDPLDGTKGFIRGVDGYAVQVGLVEGNDAVLGVVFEPLNNRLYHAVKGQGTTLESPLTGTRRLRVSSRSLYPEMPLIASSSLRKSLRDEVVGSLGLAQGSAARSVGIKVGHLLRHNADVYVSPHPVHYWDSCAPWVILREAGGRWTTPGGDDLQFDLAGEHVHHPGPFIASNGTRHDDLRRDIGAILGW